MIKVYFDGSCQPKNPGGRAGFGWIAYEDDGQKAVALSQNHGFIGEGPAMSNNVAEYGAVISAMEWIGLKFGDCAALFIGDSKLVIEQMSGRWKIKRGLYADSARKAKALKRKLWRFEWIPRDLNEEADALAEMGAMEHEP